PGAPISDWRAPLSFAFCCTPPLQSLRFSPQRELTPRPEVPATVITKRISLFLLAALVLAPLAAAQDWAKERLEKSPRHREWVTVKHDGRNVETFIAYPESKDKRPVVLVIHEIFGMTDWVQELADEVAEAGYIAVAPDLLSGMAPGGGRSKDFPQGAANEA